MATIQTVAHLAGVSLSTVSRAINGGEKVSVNARRKIDDAITKLNYRPNANARALVQKNNNLLGVVLPATTEPALSRLGHAIMGASGQYQLQPIMSIESNQHESESGAIENLMALNIKAMLVHSVALSDEVLIEYSQKVPGFILLNRYIKRIGNRCVWLDSTTGGTLLARHLINRGHRNLAVICNSHNLDESRLRLAGVGQAMHAEGITLPPGHIEYALPDHSGGERAIRNLLSKAINFSAVLAFNDAMASGAMATLFDQDLRVPEDISVVSFDDSVMASYCRPAITALHCPVDIMADKAIRLARDYSNGEKPGSAVTYKYKPTITKRDSVMKIRLKIDNDGSHCS